MTTMLAALPPVRTEAGLQLRIVRPGMEVPVRVWSASYSGSGRMQVCGLLTAGTVGENLVASGVMPLYASTEQVRIFFLEEEALTPLRDAEEYRVG